MAEYSIYPFDYMRITQNHNQGNHIPHWNPFKDYADKPWDEASKDGGRQYFIPQNNYVIEEILIDVRSVRLRTEKEVKIPYQEEPIILYVTLTHMKKETLDRLRVGQVIHKGEKVILEGNEGGASGNHFHCTANIGKYYGLKHNSNGKWVFCYEKSLLPDEAFYVDPNFTTIINANGYNFNEIPTVMEKGDVGENISKLNYFLAQKVYGTYYGDYTEACVAVYKKQHNIPGDGSTIDTQTLEEMKKEGLKI